MSLNEGFELDDEGPSPTQVEEQTAVSDSDDSMPFEFSGAMTDMAAAQSNAQDLTYLRNDIAGAGGMSKTFALEADRLIPGFLAERPLGFFTELPTKTQYAVSLESVKEAIENATSRIWEAFCSMLEAFKAFLDGVIEAYKEHKQREDQDLIGRIVKNSTQVAHGLDKMNRMLDKPDHTVTLVMEKLGERSETAEKQEALRRRLTVMLRHYKNVDEDNVKAWSTSIKFPLWLRFFFAGQKPKIDFGHAVRAGESLFEEINQARQRLAAHGNEEAASGDPDGHLARHFRADFEHLFGQKERQLLAGMTTEEAMDSIKQFSHPISVSDFYLKSVSVIQSLSSQNMLMQDVSAYEQLSHGLDRVIKSLRESEATSKKLNWHADYRQVLRAMQTKAHDVMNFARLYIGMSQAFRQLAHQVEQALHRGVMVSQALKLSGFTETEINRVKDLVGLAVITSASELLNED